MSQTVLVLLIAFFWCIILLGESSAKTTPKYASYNSSDISYLSNGIQIPAQVFSEVEELVVQGTTTNISDIEWMKGLYNHLEWRDRTNLIRNNNQCKKELVKYIGALRNSSSWALKMNDASGRYAGQFFFGNDYWLGSSTLCQEMQNPKFNAHLPPFPLHFYVAKIRININDQLTPVTRQVNLGQCLPLSCTTNDVRLLLLEEKSHGTSMTIVGVRAVPGDYSIWSDTKFHITGGLGLLVAILVLIATIVEYLTEWKIKKSNELSRNNNNNNNLKNHNGQLDVQDTRELGFCLRLLLCFSAIKNGTKILNMSAQPKDSIKCIHGLRFLSIAWIILVHTYLELFAIADNKSLRLLKERNFMYQTISNATFSVDTFFFISGLLVTVVYFRKDAKRRSAKITPFGIGMKICEFLTLVFYRLIRLTPAYLFVLGLNEIAMRYYHNNSVFSPAILDHISCTKYWWRNILYINNFYPQQEFCMLWSWYMSNDTQFFLMAAILLLTAVSGQTWFRLAASVVGIFLMTSWITTFAIAWKYDFVVRIEEPFALFDQLYDKPWLRVGPYLIGMIAGYVLFKIDLKMHISRWLAVVLWSISFMSLGSLVYGVGREGLALPTSAFYASLGHTAWALSLAWITIACSTGYGGPINHLLAFRGFLPLSRLTYCTYLIHPMLMCIFSFEMDGPLHLGQGMLLVIYFGNAIVSFMAAFFITIGFEAPFIQILNLNFMTRKPNRVESS